MSTALTLVVQDSQSGQNFEATFDRFPVRIGRNQLNDLHLDRAYVSQFHASIELNNGRLTAKDLGSTNGTVHNGQRMIRDQPVDLAALPELQIGPLVVRFSLVEQAVESVARTGDLSILDAATPAGAAIMNARTARIQPGHEEPFMQQLLPYIDAYRTAWSNVYRLVYEHLTRLQPEIRETYIKRLLIEHPAIAQESDFQKIAQYYGTECHELGPLTMASAAQACVAELARYFGSTEKFDDPAKLLNFSRSMRDTMDVFLKCFVSLRDGHQEFEAEMLLKERLEERGNLVGGAKDHNALAKTLFDPDGNTTNNCRDLHEIFVEVMTHQVAMIQGVMEGVRQLLEVLSPPAIEKRYDASGRKGGLFNNKYEGLWEEYQTVHADYQDEQKETFSTIFGPGFIGAYAKTAGEAY